LIEQADKQFDLKPIPTMFEIIPFIGEDAVK